MDADDHDFDEVRQVHLLDSKHELATLNYDPPETEARIPVAQHRLEPAIDDMVARAETSLPPSEFKQDIIEVLKDCYSVGHTLCAAFGSLLLTMTRGTGLAVVHPAAPELKAIATPLFEREVIERSESSSIAQKTTEELVRLGYHAQVQIKTAADRLNLFYAAPGRFHVIAENGGFRIAADGRLIAADELTKLVRNEPDRFSPNVLLRPLFQDTLLPTLAYVAGPNELAYFAQLGGLYEHFGLTMPIIAPRASFTLVEKPQKKFIERYRVALADLRANDESLLNRILKEQAPPQLENDMAHARKCVQELTETLERDLSVVDPTLGPTVRSTRGKLLHQLNTLETKGLRAIKRKDETLRNQFLSTRTTLFPCFDMQERRISPIQYFSKYGWYFTDMLRKHLDPTARSHVLLYP
jgi:bacillithiol biosynthesis cysteine-adding enzyme BshC